MTAHREGPYREVEARIRARAYELAADIAEYGHEMSYPFVLNELSDEVLKIIGSGGEVSEGCRHQDGRFSNGHWAPTPWSPPSARKGDT